MSYVPPAISDEDAKVIRRFHELLYNGVDGNHLFMTIEFMGVPCLKNPLDLWIYQEIIYNTIPEVVIECGVANGGTTLYLATILEQIELNMDSYFNKSPVVIGIDIDKSRVDQKVIDHPYVLSIVNGDSVGDEQWVVKGLVNQFKGDPRTMVILDSDHSKDHVLAEMEAYGPMVTPGCYMIVEDGNVNGNPVFPTHGPGPAEAIAEFLAAHSGEWEVDRRAERLLVTYNPGGYLRKVK